MAECVLPHPPLHWDLLCYLFDVTTDLLHPSGKTCNRTLADQFSIITMLPPH